MSTNGSIEVGYFIGRERSQRLTDEFNFDSSGLINKAYSVYGCIKLKERVVGAFAKIPLLLKGGYRNHATPRGDDLYHETPE